MRKNRVSLQGFLDLLPVPLTRILLYPLLLANNLVGRWKSRNHANPRKVQSSLGQVSPKWRLKIDDVLSSPDNAHIPRVANAGQLKGGMIVMHNGIEVGALGYYGSGILNMLIENKGVHEPQEERAFAEILRCLPSQGTMIELGAYWGFYSLWFTRTVSQPRCFLVEPSYACLQSGKTNFRHAGYPAQFEQAYVSNRDTTACDGTPMISVDGFCRRHNIEHVNILHADIQNAEVDMLIGAKNLLTNKKADYIFISTHSNELHRTCVEMLTAYDYVILASADVSQSYSVDGLIVAKRRGIPQPEHLTISQKPRTAD